jgi:hypothetical protein
MACLVRSSCRANVVLPEPGKPTSRYKIGLIVSNTSLHHSTLKEFCADSISHLPDVVRSNYRLLGVIGASLHKFGAAANVERENRLIYNLAPAELLTLVDKRFANELSGTKYGGASDQPDFLDYIGVATKYLSGTITLAVVAGPNNSDQYYKVSVQYSLQLEIVLERLSRHASRQTVFINLVERGIALWSTRK